jgi:PAS domain S-box-containing protein
MHQVHDLAELGATIDEYHARFQIRYVAVLPHVAETPLDAPGHAYGRPHPEVLMEVKFPSQAVPHSIFRTRKMVLFDELGHPNCMVFIMHKTASETGLTAKFSDLVTIFRDAAAILRQQDDAVLAANSAYLRGAAPDATPPDGENLSTIVEVDGTSFRLVLNGQVTKAASAGQHDPSALETGSSLFLGESALRFTLDGDMRIVDVSQTWLDWLGYTRNAVIGRKIFELMPASLVEAFEHQAQAQMRQSGGMLDVPVDFVAKSGDIVNALLSAAALPRRGDEPALLATLCVDVTSQKQLEETVAATIAIAPVPMIVRGCDDGRIVHANEAFFAATGFAAADVLGHGFDEFASFETMKRRESFDAAVQATGRGEPTDMTLATNHGDKLDCMLTATKIRMLGKPCMLLVLQDVSDRRRTELELMSALEAVMNDSSWFSRSVVERLAALRAPSKAGRHAAGLGDLTPRERDVLSLISLGLPDIEIAERLGLTKSTIRNHLSTLYSKINVKNRGSAIIWARDRCLNVTQLPLRPKKLQTVSEQASRRHKN